MSDIDVVRCNASVEDAAGVLRGLVGPSLAKAGIPSERQRWETQVHDGTAVSLDIVCRVLDLEYVFGRGKTAEALRSRMTRAARDVPGWEFVKSHYALWRDPEGRMHWDSVTVSLTRPRRDFVESPPTGDV